MTSEPCGQVDSGHVHPPIALPDTPSQTHTYIHAGQSLGQLRGSDTERDTQVDMSTNVHFQHGPGSNETGGQVTTDRADLGALSAPFLAFIRALPEWHRRAACEGRTDVDWFPSRNSKATEAKAVCATYSSTPKTWAQDSAPPSARKRLAQHNESINPPNNAAAGLDLGDTIKGESHGWR